MRLKARAEKEPEQNWFIKLHALGNHSEGQLYSFLDTFAGYTRADKVSTGTKLSYLLHRERGLTIRPVHGRVTCANRQA